MPVSEGGGGEGSESAVGKGGGQGGAVGANDNNPLLSTSVDI
jgi:hypothetical protein